MGMNFFLSDVKCEKCGCVKEEPIHIGKSSYGWTFHFHGRIDGYDDNEKISCFKKWKELIENPNKIILDEDGGVIDKQKFFDLVESKKDGLNIVNVVNCNPISKKEIEYMREISRKNYYKDLDFSEDFWFDSEKYNFSQGHFR